MIRVAERHGRTLKVSSLILITLPVIFQEREVNSLAGECGLSLLFWVLMKDISGFKAHHIKHHGKVKYVEGDDVVYLIDISFHTHKRFHVFCLSAL